ncbi:hypothetical protein ACROYT_G014340 [Oculina patagonica]
MYQEIGCLQVGVKGESPDKEQSPITNASLYAVVSWVLSLTEAERTVEVRCYCMELISNHVKSWTYCNVLVC